MNMAGRPDLAMNRIAVSFPDDYGSHSLLQDSARRIVFGFKVEAASGENLACGQLTRDGKLHNYINRKDEQHDIPDEFDVGSIYHPEVHRRIAKQIVAMTLCGYDPVAPGVMTDEEERCLVDEKHGKGTYDRIEQLVADYRHLDAVV